MNTEDRMYRGIATVALMGVMTGCVYCVPVLLGAVLKASLGNDRPLSGRECPAATGSR